MASTHILVLAVTGVSQSAFAQETGTHPTVQVLDRGPGRTATEWKGKQTISGAVVRKNQAGWQLVPQDWIEREEKMHEAKPEQADCLCHS